MSDTVERVPVTYQETVWQKAVKEADLAVRQHLPHNLRTQLKTETLEEYVDYAYGLLAEKLVVYRQAQAELAKLVDKRQRDEEKAKEKAEKKK